jgi:hypothetical protein
MPSFPDFLSEIPKGGTFYDFLSRLWLSDKNNLSNPVHPPKEKPKKPEKKGEKAPPVEKATVKDLLKQFIPPHSHQSHTIILSCLYAPIIVRIKQFSLPTLHKTPCNPMASNPG